MNSLEEGCTPLKARYDECFNAWFRDSFLRGKVDHEKSCGELFSAYQKCLKAALDKQKLTMPELHEDILGTEREKKPDS